MGFGDELMTSGICRVLQQKDPRKVKLDFGKLLWNEVWDLNPRIAQPGEEGDFQVYRPREGGLRPYCTQKTPTRWTWKDYKPEVGELYFSTWERQFGSEHSGLVIIDPTVKNTASPNKQWPHDCWRELVRLLRHNGLEPIQVGPPKTVSAVGAYVLETPSFRAAAAVLARAKVAVVHEGGLHHAAAAVGLPAVVIYGGFISPRQTGYDMHANLFTGGEPCGWRIPCRHCEEAMAKIEPQLVLEEALRLCRDRESTKPRT